MGKSKGAVGVSNRHIYSRASYLYQAANYLSSQETPTSQPGASQAHAGSIHGDDAAPQSEDQAKAVRNMSRKLVSEMRAVCLKAQIRQSPALKRTMCKFCDTLQVEGRTSRSMVENKSKGAKLPWADVLVMECKLCGHKKRFPVSEPRQKRRPERIAHDLLGQPVGG